MQVQYAEEGYRDNESGEDNALLVSQTDDTESEGDANFEVGTFDRPVESSAAATHPPGAPSVPPPECWLDVTRILCVRVGRDAGPLLCARTSRYPPISRVYFL